VFKKAIRYTKKLIVNFSPDLTIFIIISIVTSLLTPVDPWNLKNLFIEKYSNELAILIYAISVLIIIILLVLLNNFIRVVIEEMKFKKLEKLSILRKEGVKIRNKFESQYEDADESTINDYKNNQWNSWCEKTLESYKDFNPARAEIWNILDRFTLKTKTDINHEYDFLLSIMDAKIDRLTKDISYFLKLVEK